MAEDLQRLLLGLRFLAGDERNDVAHHFRPILERLARAGNGLVRAHDDLVRLEFLPCGQSRGIGLDGAVRLDGDEAILRAEALFLRFNDGKVIGVDFRHDHRHVLDAAAGAVVAHDRDFVLRVGFLQRADFVLLHVHGAENEVHMLAHFVNIRRIDDGHARHLFRNLPRERPTLPDRLAVRLSGTARRRRHTVHLKPRMILQQRNKALTDHARCANNAYTILLHWLYPPSMCFC